jgi:hypothetical protein
LPAGYWNAFVPVQDDRLQCNAWIEMHHDALTRICFSHGLAGTSFQNMGQDY